MSGFLGNYCRFFPAEKSGMDRIRKFGWSESRHCLAHTERRLLSSAFKSPIFRFWEYWTTARMGLTQPKVSGVMRGDFSNVSERKFMDRLNRLGYDIEIKVKPAAGAVGHLRLAVA